MNLKTQTTNPKLFNINRKALKLNSIEMGVKATRNEF
jgi:hypothetical protein